MSLRFILLAGIVALNAFFAAAEVALVSVRRSRLKELAKQGSVPARAALELLANPERLLSLTQVGVTLASLGLGWAGEDTLYQVFLSMFAPLMHWLPSSGTSTFLHGLSFALGFLAMSYVHVVVGEVVPKNLAIEKADRLALLVAPVLLVVYRIAIPFVYVVERSAVGVSRAIGLEGRAHGAHSPEELKFIVESSRKEGHLEGFEEVAIHKLLDLQNVNAREIMTPRIDIISVSVDATLDEILRILLEHQFSRLRQMWVCAWAYALTGDETYARRAREILIGYANRYSKYPYHSNTGKMTDQQSSSGGHVFEQTLNEASWMEEVCESYDLVRASQTLTTEDHRAIRDDLLLQVYQNIAKHNAGKSNWQTYHNAAFMMIGGVLNRPDLVRRALEDKENGFYYQMEASVLPGGMWYENSWGYHFYTLGAVERIVETARRLGIDLYPVPQVKEMYAVALDYRMADGTLPRFGDATTTRIPGGLYEAAYHHWRDSRFLALLPNPPTWDSVLYGRAEKPAQEQSPGQSTLQTGPGHAILRAGAATAALTFGPFGGFHGHFDKLSFVYFNQGKELGYDPGRARSQAYRLPIHKNWYRATTSHNTVLVDRVSQEGTEGQSELFVNAQELSAVAAHTGRAYPGVLHRRLLVLRPGFLVVADVLTAEDGKTHTFDWLYHNRGETISSAAAGVETSAPEGQGFEYLKDLRRGETGGQIQASVAMGLNQVAVRVSGEAQSQVLVGTGAGESVLDRVPLLMVTRRGQSARFAATIELTAKGQAGEVEEVDIQDETANSCVIRVQLRNQSEELYAYDPAGALRTVGGVLTDSKLLCLRRENGQTFQVIGEAKK